MKWRAAPVVYPRCPRCHLLLPCTPCPSATDFADLRFDDGTAFTVHRGRKGAVPEEPTDRADQC